MKFGSSSTRSRRTFPESKHGQFGYGDVWTWVAIDADTKWIPSWKVGTWDGSTAYEFVHDLAGRLSHRVQLTTDGYRAYLEAVESAFGMDVHYAMLQKIYGVDPELETRYSPAKCISCLLKTIAGDPNPKHISTSYIERQHLTMRMQMRRFTRLNERVPQEGREPRGRVCATRSALQFWEDSQDAASHPRDGSWYRGPCLVS